MEPFPCPGSCRKPREQARFGNPMPAIEEETSRADGVDELTGRRQGLKVLEVGAGLGLLGLTAQSLF